MFFFQILYSASIRRSLRTSETSLFGAALAAAASVPVMVDVTGGNDNNEMDVDFWRERECRDGVAELVLNLLTRNP